MSASKTIAGIIIIGSLALTGCQASAPATDAKPTKPTESTQPQATSTETEAAKPEAPKPPAWEDANGEWVSTNPDMASTLSVDVNGTSEQVSQGRATGIALSFNAMQGECFAGKAQPLEADGTPSQYGGYGFTYCPANLAPPAGTEFDQFPGDLSKERVWMGIQIGYPYQRR